MSGPCTPYFEPESLWPRLCFPSPPSPVEQAAVVDTAVRASSTLWALLGRQFHGDCSATVRPVRSGGSCWDRMAMPLGIHQWSDFDTVIDLHNPTRRVAEVLVDGAPFTAFYLRNGNQLVRTDGGSWPANQSLHLPDSSVGTFSVRYHFGPETPDDVVAAAMELAEHLYLTDYPKPGQRIDHQVTGVTRQGVTENRQRDLETARTAGPSLPLVMAAMATWNPLNQRTPADVYPGHREWELVVVSHVGPSVPTP